MFEGYTLISDDTLRKTSVYKGITFYQEVLFNKEDDMFRLYNNDILYTRDEFNNNLNKYINEYIKNVKILIDSLYSYGTLKISKKIILNEFKNINTIYFTISNKKTHISFIKINNKLVKYKTRYIPLKSFIHMIQK